MTNVSVSGLYVAVVSKPRTKVPECVKYVSNKNTAELQSINLLRRAIFPCLFSFVRVDYKYWEFFQDNNHTLQWFWSMSFIRLCLLYFMRRATVLSLTKPHPLENDHTYHVPFLSVHKSQWSCNSWLAASISQADQGCSVPGEVYEWIHFTQSLSLKAFLLDNKLPGLWALNARKGGCLGKSWNSTTLLHKNNSQIIMLHGMSKTFSPTKQRECYLEDLTKTILRRKFFTMGTALESSMN